MAVKASLSNRGQLILALCSFAGLALICFHSAFAPGQVLFSNDGPVGELMSACHQLPQRFTGCWEDLHYAGYREGAATPNISFFLQWMLGPVWFSRLYTPLALMILGLSAWTFFRQLKLGAPACILGGGAAMMQSAFFSVACWGVAAHTLTIAMTFLALAALVDTSASRRGLRTVLAGFCVGMGVAEGADVGALCSLFVVVFVIYQALIAEGSRPKNISIAAGRVALMAICAALLASCALSELVSNNITDIHGAKQDAETRAQRWNWATQWSLPKKEALGIVVPGLFGYRLETGDGSDYWGAIGRAAEWSDYFSNGSQGTPPTEKYLRSSGTGYYTGALVIILALWAVLQSLRKTALFDSTQRRWIWFWSVTIIISLLLAFGRYAPFYRVIYSLPYFSTIRNPIKFLYFFSMGFVALFAFGVDGLWRGFVDKSAVEQKRTKPGSFEKFWLLGSLVTVVLSLIAWFIYASHRQALEQYLQTVRFQDATAHSIALFSIRCVGLFIALSAIALLLVNLALRRFFTDRTATMALVIFGLFLTLDQGLANRPWIISLDYQDQNLTNPVLDALRDKPYEHRVALVPLRASPAPSTVDTAYRADWQMHQFPYFDIQSLDIAQLPRTPEDMTAFKKQFDQTTNHLVRKWQLTNTRYLIGDAGLVQYLNDKMDSEGQRFRTIARFNFVPRPGVLNVAKVFDLTAMPYPKGPFALIEFTGALPRARLYSQWQTNSDTSAVLDQIASPAFDPEQTVMVTGDVPAPPGGPAQNAGTVSIESYAPKRIQLKAEAAGPAVLLLNDRFDPNWRVFVDGRRETLLRCNYLMRGVYLPAGSHSVEFRFVTSTWPLYVSLATLAVGILFVGFTLVTSRPREAQKENPKETPKPQRPAPKRNGATAAASRK